MTLVVDASVVVSALVDAGSAGVWAEGELRQGGLLAPHNMPAEAANAFRRLQLAGAISEAVATAAVRDLGDLEVDLAPFAPFSERVWDLRKTVTSYDAWYVAIAEAVECPLATRDHRLASAPGPVCSFRTPVG